MLVELVITKDNGEIETFNAYRVQHSNSRGPYKGGLRYHPQVDLDDVRRHADPSVPACAAPLTHSYGASAMLTCYDHCGCPCAVEACEPPRREGGSAHGRQDRQVLGSRLHSVVWDGGTWSEVPVRAAWRR